VCPANYGERYHLKMLANAYEKVCNLIGDALGKLREKFCIEIEPPEAAVFGNISA
jgi:hypothetical protein